MVFQFGCGCMICKQDNYFPRMNLCRSVGFVTNEKKKGEPVRFFIFIVALLIVYINNNNNRSIDGLGGRHGLIFWFPLCMSLNISRTIRTLFLWNKITFCVSYGAHSTLLVITHPIWLGGLNSITTQRNTGITYPNPGISADTRTPRRPLLAIEKKSQRNDERMKNKNKNETGILCGNSRTYLAFCLHNYAPWLVCPWSDLLFQNSPSNAMQTRLKKSTLFVLSYKTIKSTVFKLNSNCCWWMM